MTKSVPGVPSISLSNANDSVATIRSQPRRGRGRVRQSVPPSFLSKTNSYLSQPIKLLPKHLVSSNSSQNKTKNIPLLRNPAIKPVKHSFDDSDLPSNHKKLSNSKRKSRCQTIPPEFYETCSDHHEHDPLHIYEASDNDEDEKGEVDEIETDLLDGHGQWIAPKHLLRCEFETCSYEDSAIYQRDSPFIRSGFRTHFSIGNAFRSMVRLHNETLNIHTHFLPIFMFLYMFWVIYTVPTVIEYGQDSKLHFTSESKWAYIFSLTTWFDYSIDIGEASKFIPSLMVNGRYEIPSLNQMDNREHFDLFLVYFGSAITCFTFSTIFHTFHCVSHRMNKATVKCDIVGIIGLICCSFVPPLYYIYVCMPNRRVFYVKMMVIAGIFCFFMLIFPVAEFVGYLGKLFKSKNHKKLNKVNDFAVNLIGNMTKTAFPTIQTRRQKKKLKRKLYYEKATQLFHSSTKAPQLTSKALEKLQKAENFKSLQVFNKILRTTSLCLLAALGVIPCIELVWMYEPQYVIPTGTRIASLLFVYGFGVLFYVSKFPERVWPGKFDIFFSSHQIWHIFVVLGAWFHLDSIIMLYQLFHLNAANSAYCDRFK